MNSCTLFVPTVPTVTEIVVDYCYKKDWSRKNSHCSEVISAPEVKEPPIGSNVSKQFTQC